MIFTRAGGSALGPFLLGVFCYTVLRNGIKNDWKPVMNTPRNTTYLTLGQAARETGKSKSVISKAISTGQLSTISKDDSGYKIDPAELFRVFPQGGPENTKNDKKERLETPTGKLENTYKIKELELKLEVSQERIREKDQAIAEIRLERDSWRNQAERLSLTYQPEPPRMPQESDLSAVATSPSKNRFTRQDALKIAFIVLFVAGAWWLISDHNNRTLMGRLSGPPAPVEAPAVTGQ